jgi:hypothetical protein
MKAQKTEQEVLESVKGQIERKWKNDLYGEALDMVQYGLDTMDSRNRQRFLTRAAMKLGDYDLLTLFAQQDICAQVLREQRKEETAFC